MIYEAHKVYPSTKYGVSLTWMQESVESDGQPLSLNLPLLPESVRDYKESVVDVPSVTALETFLRSKSPNSLLLRPRTQWHY